MKRLLLLAGIALALCPPTPAIANGWVRNPADLDAALAEGLWIVLDTADSLGDPIGVTLSSSQVRSPAGGWALISEHCASHFTLVMVNPKESIISFGPSSTLAAKVDGARYRFPVEHEIGEDTFRVVGIGHQMFRRAIREELPVKIAVPIYQEPDEVFEWSMKGGAAALAEACP